MTHPIKIIQTKLSDKIIKGDFCDSLGVEWNYVCCVRVSRCAEIEHVSIHSLEAFDASGEPIEDPLINEALIRRVEESAGKKALEQLESIDFEIEEDI